MATSSIMRKTWKSKLDEKMRRAKRDQLLKDIKSKKRFVVLNFNYGISRATYFRLKAGIKKQGLKKQLASRAGRKPKVTPELINLMKEKTPTQLGYPVEFWDLKSVKHLAWKKYRKSISLATASRYLCKKPTK